MGVAHALNVNAITQHFLPVQVFTALIFAIAYKTILPLEKILWLLLYSYYENF